MAPDPTPGRQKRAAKATTGKATSKPRGAAASTAGRPEMVQELAEELEMYAGLLALSWSLRDPVCAPVLSEQSHDIAVSLAVLIGRSERALMVLHGGGLMADIVRVLTAIAPVVAVAKAHHMNRSKEGSDDDADTGLAAYPAFRPPVG